MNRDLAYLLLAVAGLAVVAVVATPPDVPARWAMLEGLHPAVVSRFVTLLHRIERLTGGEVVLTSGYRPGEAGSYHYFGLASDLNVIVGGVWLRKATPKAQWEASGVPAIIRAAGFRWGGDFVTTGYDPVHVDVGHTYDLPALRSRAQQLATTTGHTLATFDGRTVPLS